ncbi:MAG: dihydrofolate reductase family protein [Phycisphaerales bacterium]
MRKVRIFEHVSLDGVIAPGAPGEYGDDFANGGWTAPYRSPTGAGMVLEASGVGFDLLLGRRTYDLWAGYWPKAGSHPMANALNAATKYVATHRSEGLSWGPVQRLGADVVESVRALRSTDGADLIVWGSATLTNVLFANGQVDEVVLITYPLLLGRGKRFFAESADPRELAHVSTKSTPTGVFLNTYRYVGALRTE